MPDDDTTGQPLTLLQRRLIDAAADIIEEQADSPEYLHSVLCQVGLPRAKTDARSFERSSGTAAIEIEAGKLYKRGKFVPAPMPYGAKPRLVLMHLCAEAVRTRSPEIQVGRSANEFLGRLGLDNGGHEYARFRAQMEALAACRMTLGMQAGGKEITVNTQPISRFEAWMQHDHRSLGLWPGLMVLSGEFTRPCWNMLCRSIPGLLRPCKNQPSLSTFTHGWRTGFTGCGNRAGSNCHGAICANNSGRNTLARRTSKRNSGRRC